MLIRYPSHHYFSYFYCLLCMAYACIYGYINNIVGTCQALVQRESFRFLSLLVKQLGPWIGCVLRGNHEVHQANKALKQSRGALVGLAPTNKAPSPSNWNMKHYKLVEFLSNLNVKPPLHECKALPRTNVKSPYWRLSGDGSALKQLRFAFLSYLSIFLQLWQIFCREPLPSYWRFFLSLTERNY